MIGIDFISVSADTLASAHQAEDAIFYRSFFDIFGETLIVYFVGN